MITEGQKFHDLGENDVILINKKTYAVLSEVKDKNLCDRAKKNKNLILSEFTPMGKIYKMDRQALTGGREHDEKTKKT